RRKGARPDIGFECDDRGQLERVRRAVHLALIMRDNVDPIQKDRLDGGLPWPDGQRVITERGVIRIEDERGAPVGMADKIGMIHLTSLRFLAACKPTRMTW